MHQAAILGHSLKDAKAFGWGDGDSGGGGGGEPVHDWTKLVSGVQDHIGGLNFGYKVELREKRVKYVNAYGRFTDPHTVVATDKKGKETTLTAASFVIATGGRPSFPDIPGARELGISSDDLFSLKAPPGKTLVVGASYVALECAGFLAGLGFETTVMVRSILLRGFDQEMAEKIGAHMAADPKLTFVRPATPTKLEKTDDGRIRVEYRGGEPDPETGDRALVVDTVLFATGRHACTKEIGLGAAGVKLDHGSGKVLHNEQEQTNVPHIFAIGDVLFQKLELTPVAIKAGVRLADRLYADGNQLTNYVNVPTTVFTPLEYGCIGLAEEDAIKQLGPENVEVFHQSFTPLEHTVAHRPENTSFAKLICNKADAMRVVGLHVVGPNSGEVTQGFGLAFNLGATKADFDNLVGIHPTLAETFTTLTITKASGEDAASKGC